MDFIYYLIENSKYNIDKYISAIISIFFITKSIKIFLEPKKQNIKKRHKKAKNKKTKSKNQDTYDEYIESIWEELNKH